MADVVWLALRPAPVARAAALAEPVPPAGVGPGAGSAEGPASPVGASSSESAPSDGPRCAAALGDVSCLRYLHRVNKIAAKEEGGANHWDVRSRMALLRKNVSDHCGVNYLEQSVQRLRAALSPADQGGLVAVDVYGAAWAARAGM